MDPETLKMIAEIISSTTDDALSGLVIYLSLVYGSKIVGWGFFAFIIHIIVQGILRLTFTVSRGVQIAEKVYASVPDNKRCGSWCGTPKQWLLAERVASSLSAEKGE